MKKITFIFISFLMISLVANAQMSLRFGVKGGVDFDSPYLKDGFKSDNYTGFHAGIITEFMPLSGFGFDAAILYSESGLKLKGKSDKLKSHHLEIPVNLKVKIGLVNMVGIYATAGPYAHFKLSDSFNEFKHQFKEKTFGAGFNFGFGVEIAKHLQIGASYKYGVTDDFAQWEDSDQSIKGKSRGWSISTAYFF